MNDLISLRPLKIFLEDDEGQTEIDLSKLDLNDFFRKDLVRYQLTGTLPPGPDFHPSNFVSCIFHQVDAGNISFKEVDFKDTLVKSSRFVNCQFDGGAFATTFFAETEFTNCTFYNLSAHNCDFHRVKFAKCDLTNLLVKSSRFSECLFEDCITSNKICEMSTLFETRFSNTPIQIETITNNFGLIHSNAADAPIRSGRVRHFHTIMNDEDLRTLLASDDLSNLEKLSLEYYLEETLLNGSKVLDKSLDITQWTRLYKNPGSFIELLEKFAAFVVHLYDNDKIAIHPLLLFHHVTSTLSHNSTREEKAHNLITSIGGVHLMLSQIVEEFLALLDMTSRILGNKLDFLAEGPLDKQFYLDLLGPFIKDRNVEISKLERNSPLHIELTSPEAISLLSLLAAFLATRTKLEITKLRSTLEKRQPADKNKGVRGKKSEALMPKTHSRKTNQSLISFSSGMITKPTPAYEFRVKALIPGSLLMDLRLNFSTTFLRRLRGVLIDILVDSKRKRS